MREENDFETKTEIKIVMNTPINNTITRNRIDIEQGNITSRVIHN